jgi:hypothetical protein
MTDPRQEIEGVHITRLGEQGADGPLAQVIVQPGTSVPPLGDVKTVNLHVKDGAVRVSISEGAGSVRVASGQPIRSGEGDIVLCETGTRDISIGDSAVLTAGNGCFVKDGVLNIEVVGDQAAELQMGAKQRGKSEREASRLHGAKPLKSPDDGGITLYACWLCPFM